MQHLTIPLEKRMADGYSIPVGGVHLIFVTAGDGLIGCGAFDIAALEKFGVPAAKMQAMTGPAITSIEEILYAEVKEANTHAVGKGIVKGMIGKEALELL
ncbi:hypothetical protein RJ53_06075 [Methanocalculus chunghsingensis]|uniref:DUF1805 domain-containing protein n=1 Tax=Methanocalculus chunghsingensis TaxID=156457 RepID=A0A8J7W688_9EURY|nr:YunC family protein [Methanocalculus chunghsingensis]MBR1369089.1 hypothetical protein [Methanocalculus chunghsingensis]